MSQSGTAYIASSHFKSAIKAVDVIINDATAAAYVTVCPICHIFLKKDNKYEFECEM
jgi:hypothetical protein